MDCFRLVTKGRTKTEGGSSVTAEVAGWWSMGHIHLPKNILSGSYSLYEMFNIKLTLKP